MQDSVLIVGLVLLLQRNAVGAATPWNQAGPDWAARSPWFRWIPSHFVLPAIWADSTCFDVEFADNGKQVKNRVPFDADEECSVCPGTWSMPGFAADPNDCSRFYMCAHFYDKWRAFSKQCPRCQFWNQEKLECTIVYRGPECGFQRADGPAHEPIYAHNMLTCVNFDHGYDKFQGLGWHWVKASGVQSVSGPDCYYNKCGYFNGHATLDIPFFSNNYHHKAFTLSMFFRRTGGTNHQGLISNDYFKRRLQEKANSLYVSSPSAGSIRAGMTDAHGQETSTEVFLSDTDGWHHLVITWDQTSSGTLTFYLDKVALFHEVGVERPRQSHCPLVIGSFINPESANRFYFQGFLDEVCLLRRALSPDEVIKVYDDPSYLYDE